VMRVRFLKEWKGYTAGDEREVDETTGKVWVTIGVVEQIHKSIDAPPRDKAMKRPKRQKAVKYGQ